MSKPLYPTADYHNIVNTKPFQVFAMFFDDGLLSLFKSEISKYVLLKNEHDPLTSVEEMKAFICILIVSENGPRPPERLYWDSEKDMIFLIKDALRRNRFLLIKRFLHFNDNLNSLMED